MLEIIAAYGPDGNAVFGGGGLTNEKAYLLGKFARVALGTSQVDYDGRFCMSSAAAAANRAFGLDRGLPFPMSDVDDADVVLLASHEFIRDYLGGLVDAIGALGGFVVQQVFRVASQNVDRADWSVSALGAYVVCAALTWSTYLRKKLLVTRLPSLAYADV